MTAEKRGEEALLLWVKQRTKEDSFDNVVDFTGWQCMVCAVCNVCSVYSMWCV